MLKRFLCCIALAASSHAYAIDYTDIWYNPAESGWGVNMVQSDTFIFATFFIYGQNGSPTWYTGQLTYDGSSKYTGGLYATAGTYFAMPWVPGNVSSSQVGTATFTPSAANAFEGTLTYSVTGMGTVTKAIQRQSLTPITIGGLYTGGESGVYSSCSSSSQNGPYIDRYDLTVTQQTSNGVSLSFNYVSGLVCTFTGSLQQFGQLYSVPNATYVCSDGLSTAASLSEIKATGQGVEGKFSVPNVGGGCRLNGQFSAVLQ
jgi:hypothetical protein